MKIITLGDIHGRENWKKITYNEDFDKIVFIGDYFDSFNISGVDQINNFLDIIQYKKNNIDKVILLIGNHDYHYFSSIGNRGISGYQPVMAPSISFIIEENKNYLQMAYGYKNLLFTHAGVTESFMNSVFGKAGWSYDNIVGDLNDLWKYKPLSFNFNGIDPYGDDIYQSPIWIRPRSLMKDSKDLKKKYIQIVGHTEQNSIDIEGKSTNGKYYFIDTLHNKVGEYLIYNNNSFSIGKVNI